MTVLFFIGSPGDMAACPFIALYRLFNLLGVALNRGLISLEKQKLFFFFSVIQVQHSYSRILK